MTRQIPENEWDAFIATREEVNFLQSSAWGKTNELVGHTIVRYGIIRDDEIVAGWQGIIKDARRGRYLEVPGGPVADWSDDNTAADLAKQLRAVAQENNCGFVRIRPQILDEKVHQEQLNSLGFKKAPMHLHAEHTSILDMTAPEEEILAGMRRQTRYEVRRADKLGIEVSWRSDQEAIEEFFAVQAETAQRQGFVPPSKTFLLAQQQAFGDSIRIYRAEKDGVLLNLALVIWFGAEADYHEAASTPESRSLPGAYALQWRAIRDAKAAGKTRYNFWGIAYSDNPHHRYAGVTTFKRGFGGQDVAYVPAYDLVVSRMRYMKNWIVETLRRKKRKL